MAEASVAFGDLVDLIGDETMGLAVHPRGRLGIRSIDEAEDLPRLLIDPIPFVVRSVPSLRLQVRLMRAGDVASSYAAADPVHLHIVGIWISLPRDVAP